MDCSKCQYCGSRTDVFEMNLYGINHKSPLCYNCASEIMKKECGLKIEEEYGKTTFYIKEHPYSDNSEYIKCSTLLEASEYTIPEWMRYECVHYFILPRYDGLCSDVGCSKIYCKGSEWPTFNLYVYKYNCEKEVNTVCENCFLKAIGVTSIRIDRKDKTYIVYIYKYKKEIEPILAVDRKVLHENEEDINEKIIQHCIENKELKLEPIEVEYTENYEKVFGDRFYLHQFYRVISFKGNNYHHQKGYTRKIEHIAEEYLDELIDKELI